MPRISALSLNQINLQFDTLDSLRKQLADVQQRLGFVGNTASIADPLHAPQTTNNLAFTWTGSTSTLSWPQGWIKDKNWGTQVLGLAPVSSAPGPVHIWTVTAGSAVLTPSMYYWLAWDPDRQTMRITQDADSLHGDDDVQIICQIYTGTSGQSGSAGGGGSTGGSDLSGARYKNF